MTTEANNAGYFKIDKYNDDKLYHKIVILTVEDILNGKTIPHPATEITTYKGAKTVKKKADQIKLEL